MAIGMFALVAPLQLVVGDVSGLVMSRLQPAKLAAVEAIWTTRAGQATTWKGWPARVVQIASTAASLAGCSRLITRPDTSPTTSWSGATRANMPMAMRRAVRDSASSGRRSSRQAEAPPTTRAVVR